MTNTNKKPINMPKEKCQANLGHKTPVLNSVTGPVTRQVSPGQPGVGRINKGGT